MFRVLLVARLATVGVLLLTAGAPVDAETMDKHGSNATVAIRIEISNRSQLEQLTRLVSIEDVRDNDVYAHATPEQLSRLGTAGFKWTMLYTEQAAITVQMCPAGWVDNPDREWNCYPTYSQYASLMHRFAIDHPDTCRLMDLGPGNNTASPHTLWAVLISDNPDLDEDEPEVLLTSTMHGDETTGFVLMLRLIEHLLGGYGSDPEIDRLVDETEIWINPLANPDGTYRGGDHTVADAIREYTTTAGNPSEVNPNRNFPDSNGDLHPDGNPWWPETEAMMALAAAKHFVLSANFHGGIEVVNYPWDSRELRHPDDAWLRHASRTYADRAQSDSPGGYMTDLDNGITNGWDWYPIFGGRQDFMTFFHGAREFTIELSTTKILPAEELEDHWLWNRGALLEFISLAGEGIRGIVTDLDGRPLAATVEVVGHDIEADRSVVNTDPAVGDYHRLIMPGTYDLRFRASGCLNREIAGIAVVDGEAAIVDVELQCGPSIRRADRRITPRARISASGR